ncbi:uncharacterized protein DUF4251 [Winogradskyella wandonensis]|uniref:Uncharacterized protein DUF4251 n=1 Tax=Winogradskyella wandonensis TaxID=1442586 RepID=A0A4R1KVW3_9FLAO|nr:DUF4251 domain-containing protein [Winogradskyella wandonensis]TCK69284.1 uncharacterized protein DUF4251 [Winogradskyella wandonensis]
MKKLVLLVTIIAFNLSVFSQSRQERKAEKKAQLEAAFLQTKTLVESQNFQFEAQWANPLGNDATNIGLSLPGGAAIFQGNRVDVSTNPNFLKLTDSKTDLFLPFFGRVFFPNRINNQGGIEYKGEIDNYDLDINDKKKIINIKFEAKTSDDFIKFHFRITAGGNARLTVNSTNRQIISYDGQIEAIEEDNAD